MKLVEFIRKQNKTVCEVSWLCKLSTVSIYRLSNFHRRPRSNTLQRLKAVLGEEVEQCFIHQDEPVALVDLEAC